jgi:lysozyme
MSQGGNVQVAITLLDKFSGTAKSIQSSAHAIETKMGGIGRIAAATSAKINGLATAMVGFFAFSKMKEFAKAGAHDDYLGMKYDRMFEKAKDRINVGKKELDNLIEKGSMTGAFDVEDIKGKMIAPMLKTGYVSGKNMMRAAQLGMDMAAEMGGDEAAVDSASAKIQRMMSKRGFMMTARELKLGTMEEIKQMQKDMQQEKNWVAIQAKMLTAAEKVWGGSAEKFKDEDWVKMNRMTLGVKELEESVGKLFLVAFGNSFAFKGETMLRMAKEIEGVRDSLKKGENISWDGMWERITLGSLKVKAVLGGIMLIFTALVAKLAVAGLMFLGWPGLIAGAFAALVYGITHIEEVKAAWHSLMLMVDDTKIGHAFLEMLDKASFKLSGMLQDFRYFMGITDEQGKFKDGRPQSVMGRVDQSLASIKSVAAPAYEAVGSALKPINDGVALFVNNLGRAVTGKKMAPTLDAYWKMKDKESTAPSASGLDLIKKFEGNKLKAYSDAVGVQTIGYGHTGPDVHPGMKITQAQADAFLYADSVKFSNGVNKLVTTKINQNQSDALTSLSYNIGLGAFAKSTLLRKLNAGDTAGASEQFKVWNKGGGAVLQGLVNRRAEEAKLFNSPLVGSLPPVPPLKMAPSKLNLNNKVSGDISISIKDPGGNASVNAAGAGGLNLSVGKSKAGNYTSTNKAQQEAKR